jgi:hypothetical protein
MIGNGLRKAAVLLCLGAASAAAAANWPPLPTHGFIKGRPAQNEDVARGDAVFVAAVNNVVVGKPLGIAIPQYAMLRDTHQRVILVQAEEANGVTLYGLRRLNGKEVVVKDTDVDLLGTERPLN